MIRNIFKRVIFITLCFLLFILILFLIASNNSHLDSSSPETEKQAQASNSMEVEVVIQKESSSIFAEDSQKSVAKETNKERSGVFPPLWGNYREQIGFRRYAKEMQRRGAVFFYYNNSQKEWLTIDVSNRKLSPFDITKIGTEFGEKPNLIDNEPNLSKLVPKKQREKMKFFIAKPMQLERYIQNTIYDALQAKGIDMAQVTGIKGVYIYENGKFSLVIKGIGIMHKGLQEMQLNIPL